MHEWFDIEGFEKLYQINKAGQFRALYKHRSARILKPIKGPNGCTHIVLYKNGKRHQFACHSLVAKTFIPNPEGFTHIRHINGNKADNRVENLVWVKNGGNIDWTERNRRRAISMAKQKVHGLRRIRQFNLKTGKTIAVWGSIREAYKGLGIEKNERSDISSVCRGRQKSAFGYGWEYTDKDSFFAIGQYKNGKLLRTFLSQKAAVESLGLNGGSKGGIRECIRGNRKEYKGYEWRIIETIHDESPHECLFCKTTKSYAWHQDGQYCHACWQRYYKTGDMKLKCLTGPHARGFAKHPLHNTWVNMKTRCYNQKNRNYANYGGRGIKVCDRWLEKPDGFWHFVEDVEKYLGERPEGWSLDRIDVNGDYCIENVRWASPILQANNRQKSRKTRGISLSFENGCRAYIDYNGQREYSPRGLSLEEAVNWRADKEKEYGLDKELGKYPKKKAIAEVKKALRELEKQKHIQDNQNEYRKLEVS